MNEVEARIALSNLTPKKVEPMAIKNIAYHLSGVGNRVVHGDDNSVNVINEKELFDGLSTAIANAVQDEDERDKILERQDELKLQKTKSNYLAMVPKFIAAAASIGHDWPISSGFDRKGRIPVVITRVDCPSANI